MNTLRLFLLLALFPLAGATAFARDLEIKIRAHAAQVTFGDPLYIEVTITNPNKEIVAALPKYVGGERFVFMMRDPRTELQLVGYGHGKQPPSKFAPGEAVTLHQYLFLPNLRGVDHLFWKSIRAGQGVSIWGVYGIRPGVALLSNRIGVAVVPRDEEEMELIERWAKPGIPGYRKGPIPADFGVQFQSALNLEQTTEVASQVGGELGSLLRLSKRLAEIYELPPGKRDAKNRELVAWLRKQPDVKRPALARETWSLAASYNIPSTAQALKKLLDDEQAAKDDYGKLVFPKD